MKYTLHPMAAALSIGLVWAVALFLWTLVAAQNGYGSSILELLVEIYPSYQVSTGGAVWGLLWGFVDGFIGTYIIVWVYNHFLKKFNSK